MYETIYEQPGESYELEDEAEYSNEWGNESGESEAETLETELAHELLEITTEAELDRFLGKLASSVMKGASSFIKSPIGKAIGGALKSVAKNALPMVGGTLGSMVLPGVGTAIGSKLGSLAGGMLEAGEAELMSEAEAEYEAAQRYVRFARTAYSNAARTPRNVPPRAAVRAATISAARQHAPSLLDPSQRMSPWRRRRGGGAQPRGRWFYDEPVQWWGDTGNGHADGDPGFEPEPWAVDGFEFSGEAPAGRRAGPRAAHGGGPGGAPGSGQPAMEGRWVRRRGRIVVLGA